MVSAGPFAAAHAACRYRLWLHRSPDYLRRDGLEVLGVQRRDSARRKEARTPAAWGRILSCRDVACYVSRTPPAETLQATSVQRELTYVDAKESKVPQAAARTHDRQGVARQRAGFRGLWIEGAGAGLYYGPADRGEPGRHDAFRQAWGEDLDPTVSGQARHQETSGNSYGKRQRSAGSLGRGGSSRQDPVRNAFHFEQDLAGTNHRDPVIRRSFAFSHTSFRWFLGDGLVRKQSDPDLPPTLDETRHGDPVRLDLPVGNPARLQHLQSIVPESQLAAAPRLAGHASALLLAVLYFLWHQHKSALSVQTLLATSLLAACGRRSKLRLYSLKCAPKLLGFALLCGGPNLAFLHPALPAHHAV